MTNTKLLISVNNVPEALLALEAGADVIDLKDPNVGALGALPYEVTRDIVLAIDHRALVSATVGEHHHTIANLNLAIEQTASLGVDVVKIAMNVALAESLISDTSFLDIVDKLSNRKIKLVAVLFADQHLMLNVLPLLKKLNFYGVMLDTAQKNGKSLIYHLPIESVKSFVGLCAQYKFVTGLAGSLNVDSVDSLIGLKPNYIGFRGGVCHDLNRQSKLDFCKIIQIKSMLLKYNTLGGLVH